jgi:hypothetical protein
MFVLSRRRPASAPGFESQSAGQPKVLITLMIRTVSIRSVPFGPRHFPASPLPFGLWYATTVKVDALTLMGDCLKRAEKASGGDAQRTRFHKGTESHKRGTGSQTRPVALAPTLADIGITKKESSEAQALAESNRRRYSGFQKATPTERAAAKTDTPRRKWLTAPSPFSPLGLLGSCRCLPPRPETGPKQRKTRLKRNLRHGLSQSVRKDFKLV